MKTDTTRQRLLDTGLFTECSTSLFGACLTAEGAGGAEARLIFNTSGELTEIYVQGSTRNTPRLSKLREEAEAEKRRIEHSAGKGPNVAPSP